MGASVRDYFVVKTKAEKDFMEEEVGNSFCDNGFLGRAENHPLSKSMVDHNQRRVKASGEGKVGDKITGDLLKGRVEVKQIGMRGGTVGCVLDLLCWQTVHPLTYLHMKDARPGHQNSEATS